MSDDEMDKLKEREQHIPSPKFERGMHIMVAWVEMNHVNFRVTFSCDRIKRIYFSLSIASLSSDGAGLKTTFFVVPDRRNKNET